MLKEDDGRPGLWQGEAFGGDGKPVDLTYSKATGLSTEKK